MPPSGTTYSISVAYSLSGDTSSNCSLLSANTDIDHINGLRDFPCFAITKKPDSVSIIPETAAQCAL